MEKFLIITDLDASLLWHDYTYEEAKPTLQKLASHDIPVILNSSKTLSELTSLARELQSTAPVIAENGGAVCIHKDSPLQKPENSTLSGDYFVINTGLSRNFVIEKAHALRSAHGYQFEGFADWSAAKLSSVTKLSEEAAERALDRHVTEPILWDDSEEHFSIFTQQLAENEIKIVRGGKFTHLMGDVDKANGAKIVIDLYRKSQPETNWTTVAIGDSENDLNMLNQADIPVVIPHDGEIRIKPDHPHTIYATSEASKGWAESVEQIIHF